MLAFQAPLLAQQTRPFTAPSEYTIDQWTTADGLPQNSVNAIVQTRDGYLWVGTFGGLARFDGSTFSLIDRSDSSGRHIDRVLSLAEGPDSALWVGTESGLLRRKGARLDQYTIANGLPDNEVTALHVTGDGVVWIGTMRGGLTRLAEGGFETFREVDGVPLTQVVGMVEDASGVLWVNIGGRGFVTFQNGTPSTTRWRATPVSRSVHMLLQDRSGGLWFSRDNGMARVAGGVARSHDVPEALIMAEDQSDGYWMGTNLDGLFHFDPESTGTGLRHYALPDGTRNFRVRSAHTDRDGNVWIGTDADGLLRVRRRVFTTYTSQHGLSHDVTTAVLVDSAGTVWSGTNCAGVNAIDLPRETVRLFKPRKRNDPTGDPCVFALAEGPPGTVWVGTYGGGLTRVAGRREERLYGAGGLPDSVVLALFTDRDGTVWVGMGSGGLAAMENGRVRKTWTTRDGLAHDAVRTIQQTRDGALWIGTLGGLSRFQNGRFTTYTAADGLSAEHVRAIHEDEEGNLWIGTYGGGLNLFRDGVFTPITREVGLADNVVSAILEDDVGRFWMSGNRGIARVARSDLIAFVDGTIPRIPSVLYGTGDGPLNPETNGGFQSAASKDGEGRLWFPTLGGLAMVDPARVITDERPPPVLIEEVVVDGVSRAPDARIVVGPGRPNLEFRYTGLSLTDPEHLTFRYRLEGFEREWVEVGTRRVAYYPQLPPGSYRFTVGAANRDGVWNEVGAALDVRVVPPFWRAWWFQMILTVGVLGLVGARIRWRDAAVRRERAAQQGLSRRLIEGQELERKRIAGELHDGLGQELLVVKNRALLALRSRSLDPAAREQLRQIDDVVSRSLENVRSLAHNLRPDQLEHLGLTHALEAMIEAMADAGEITITPTVRKVDGLLSPEAEINLYRVVQEGLTNLVRHSSARTAAVSVRRVGGTIEVIIIDDGRGFNPHPPGRGGPGGGFGMRGMAERVRILEGGMEITSAPGRGTRIRVVVPVKGSTHPRTPPDKHESEG